MSAGPKHTKHFRAPYSLLCDTALMSAANMLLYLNPETVAYVFFRHHTLFRQRNFSSSKSVKIKHHTNSDTYFPLFLVGECLILIPAIIVPFFSLYSNRSHLFSVLLTTVSFCIVRSILRSFSFCNLSVLCLRFVSSLRMTPTIIFRYLISKRFYCPSVSRSS